MDGASDWHPDIGRGRFPVRSPEQTTYMVDKYLAYANLTGQEPWVKKASFPATCDLYTVAEGTHNYVIDTYTAPKGYIGHFPNDPQPGGDKLYCITYGATRTDLIERVQQRAVGDHLLRPRQPQRLGDELYLYRRPEPDQLWHLSLCRQPRLRERRLWPDRGLWRDLGAPAEQGRAGLLGLV